MGSFLARSVVIDIANNWGYGYGMGMRSLEFFWDGNVLPLGDSIDFTSYGPEFVQTILRDLFDTTQNKTGARYGNGWMVSGPASNSYNQRVICVFDSLKIFDGITINNSHDSGSTTDRGVKDIVITTSEDIITDTTYNAAISNSIEIFNSQIDEHTASNIVDDQELTLLQINEMVFELPVLAINISAQSIVPVSMSLAKSVVIDIANNWGYGYAMGMRSFEFFLDGNVLPLGDSIDFTSYGPEFVQTILRDLFDTTQNKTGARYGNGWMVSGTAAHSYNQRIICVFDRFQMFDGITINNSHDSGSATDIGVRDIVITTSEDIITDTTYNAAVSSNPIEIFNSQVDEHTASNIVDNQELFLIPNQQMFLILPLPIIDIIAQPIVPEGVFLAKTVVIDIFDNWGEGFTLGVRAIEFFLNSQLLTVDGTQSTALATGTSSPLVPEKAFETGLSKTGSESITCWRSIQGDSQRLLIQFNNIIAFDSIVVNNYHNSGLDTDLGVKNIVIYLSSDTISDVVFGNAIPNSKPVFYGEIAEHVASDVIDDQALTLTNEYGLVFDMPSLQWNATAFSGEGIVRFEIPSVQFNILGTVHVLGMNVRLPSLEFSIDVTTIPPYTNIEINIPPIEVEINISSGKTDLAIEIPSIEFRGYTGARINFELSLPEIEMEARTARSAFMIFDIPEISFQAQTGAILALELPFPEIEIDLAIPNNNGDIAFEIPSLKVSIDSLGCEYTELIFNLPKPKLRMTAIPGNLAVIDIAMAVVSISMRAIPGNLANIIFQIPQKLITMSMDSELLASLAFKIPLVQFDIHINNYVDRILKHIRNERR